MKDPTHMATVTHNELPDLKIPERRGHVGLVCLVLWTIFVALALWWLWRQGAHDSGPAAWVVQDADSPHKAFAERARDWFRLAHLNFQRIYPWVLFGPYVGW